jgi:hypothetical protein
MLATAPIEHERRRYCAGICVSSLQGGADALDLTS